MRVLIVNRDCRVGGGSSYIRNLNVGLRKCQVETAVVAAPGQMSREHRQTADAYFPLPVFHMAQARYLARLARKWRADLMHVHSFTQAEVVLRAANLTDLPVVWSVHGFIGPERVPRYGPLLRRASAVVAMNERLQDFYGQIAGEEKVMLSRLPLVLPTTVRGGHDVREIAYCSRLSGNKAPRAEAWLRAMASTAELRARALHILGGGKRARGLRKLGAQLELSVHWHRRAPNFSLVAGDFDVVAGAGYVALEGMAAGATAVGIGFEGCYGAVTMDRLDRAFSVNFGDQTWHPLPTTVEAVASAHQEAIEARRCGDSALVSARVRELCDSERIARQISLLYEVLCKGGSKCPADLSREGCRLEASAKPLALVGH